MIPARDIYVLGDDGSERLYILRTAFPPHAQWETKSPR
jgi:hypothetical protein